MCTNRLFPGNQEGLVSALGYVLVHCTIHNWRDVGIRTGDALKNCLFYVFMHTLKKGKLIGKRHKNFGVSRKCSKRYFFKIYTTEGLTFITKIHTTEGLTFITKIQGLNPVNNSGQNLYTSNLFSYFEVMN